MKNMYLDDAIPAGQLEAESMSDPEYRAEYERTRVANEVAVRMLAYRNQHGLSQTGLAQLLGMRQPNVARLEAGDHEPSLTTLTRLACVLGEHFTIEITSDGAQLHTAV
jgi:DNA-binding XRE family transcriptional regulator